MEFNLAFSRLAQFAALLAVFWLLDGFTMPVLSDSSLYSATRLRKAWLYCVLLFIGGAACVSLIDHYVGNIERSNIRLLYILLGALMMAGSYLWQKGLREGMEIEY